MVNNINGLTLKEILDLYSSEKMRKTLAGGTFSVRMGAASFQDAYASILPGRHELSSLDADALCSMIARVVDDID